MDKKILVDWLTFTLGIHCFLDIEDDSAPFENFKFADEYILGRACSFLCIDETNANFISKRGLHNYEKGLFLGGIGICWCGCDTIMFNFTGEGCRLAETIVPDLDWLTLIQKVCGYRRHNFSRMDVACDTFGELNMNHIFRYTTERLYISRWKSIPLIRRLREELVDFGSTKSRTMLRIYNKTLERKCNVDKNVDVPEGWVRCELQMRDDAVDSFVREWENSGCISTVYFGIMSNQLRFVKNRPDSETNLSRLETVAWWRRFLDDSKPIRLAYKGGLAYNLQSLERYLYGQAGSSIKTWLVLSDWNVDKMLEMVAYKRVNERQNALLRTMSAVKDSEVKHETT